MSLCVHVSTQVGGLFANGPKQLCFESYVVSEVIHYCNYLEFGIICMFLTSFYAHFCILCAQLVGHSKVPRDP